MNGAKLSKIIWISALVLGAVAVLGKYDLVVIKNISKYNFEILLAGYAILAITRLIKK